MTDFIQIMSTTATKDEAERIARHLVEQRLAACGQVTGPLVSVYRWQGEMERTEEWLCTLKTRKSHFAEAAAAIRELHTYKCPEIVAVPIVQGSDDYLTWLEQELQ
jgi:periplasmic divalent cation tolerance protein